MLSIYTPFPIVHMLNNDRGRAFCGVLSTYSFDKVAVRVCPFVSHTSHPAENLSYPLGRSKYCDPPNNPSPALHPPGY